MGELEVLSIGPGCQVSMHFTLSLADGTVADSSVGHDPISFILGDGSMIHGLEMALYGLKAGDQQCLSIEPRDAFGFPDPDNIHDMPREEFPADVDLKPGLIMSFSTPSGEEIPGAIMEVNEAMVKVDFNHPLAGHEIIFEVEILEIRPPQHDKADD